MIQMKEQMLLLSFRRSANQNHSFQKENWKKCRLLSSLADKMIILKPTKICSSFKMINDKGMTHFQNEDIIFLEKSLN